MGRADLAFSLGKAGRLDEARAEIAAARAAAEAVLGKDHPGLARFEVKASLIAGWAGHDDEAEASAKRAIALVEAWYGPEDPRLVNALEALGGAQAHTDRAAARVTLARQLVLLHRGNASPAVLATAEGNLAVLDAQDGHPELALEGGKRALAILEKEGETPDLVPILDLLGNVTRMLHRDHESVAYLRRSIAINDRAFGPTSSRSVRSRIGLAYTLLRQEKAKDAMAVMAPVAEALERGTDLAPPDAAIAHFALARTLWASGDHAGGRKQGQAARDGMAALGPKFDGERGQIEEWLKNPE
jgi:tetratricopeptide (TPR) repeat protein